MLTRIHCALGRLGFPWEGRGLIGVRVKGSPSMLLGRGTMDSSAKRNLSEMRFTPPDRGRLWYDFEIPNAFLAGLPGIEQKVRWIREHLPRESRIRIGQKSAWYEADIRAFLESRRAAQ